MSKRSLAHARSIKEPGLYDYVIFNDDLEEAFSQLATVARRALAGQVGNGSGTIAGPVTLVAEDEPGSNAAAAETSAVRTHVPHFGAPPRLWRGASTPKCISLGSWQAVLHAQLHSALSAAARVQGVK